MMNIETKPVGQRAIEAEMARQAADALATYEQVGPVGDDLAASIRRTGRLVLLGMGASHSAGRAVEPIYRELGIDAVALPVSEQLTQGLPLDGKTVILASQSGESAEILRWLQTARAGDVFGMTLNGSSTLGQAVPCLVAAGGAEVAFAATRSLTLTIALHLAALVRLGADPAPALAVLRAWPEPDVSAAVNGLSGVRTVVTSARRLQGVAEACALGLCELSQSPAFSLEGGQLRHGPMEIMGPELGVVLFASDEPSAELVMGMARSAAEAEAKVVLIDASGAREAIPGVTTVTLPRAQGAAAVLVTLPAMQELMVGYAADRVANVGTPRRSSKITRTE
jgi:fructoselysine-6-P-deglycase FrlB-like protein